MTFNRCVWRKGHGITLVCRRNVPNGRRVGYPWTAVRVPRSTSFRIPRSLITLCGGGGSVVFHPDAVPVLGVPYPILGVALSLQCEYATLVVAKAGHAVFEHGQPRF